MTRISEVPLQGPTKDSFSSAYLTILNGFARLCTMLNKYNKEKLGEEVGMF